jgi:hypothetical protein
MGGIHKKAKSVVKISPWQLAKLNTQEATQGAAAAATTKGRVSSFCNEKLGSKKVSTIKCTYGDISKEVTKKAFSWIFVSWINVL